MNKRIETTAEQKVYNIAIAGQPNTGKSTIFNALTGSKQHVGNWPGKTVERKEGFFQAEGNSYRIVDLPGCYSLSSAASEEIIARNYLIENKPDAVIVVVDASQLERSMYMAAEIASLRMPVILALNMMDVAEREGKVIDAAEMEEVIGARVIPMTASRNRGVSEIGSALKELMTDKKPPVSPDLRKVNGYSLLLEIMTKLQSKGLKLQYNADWITMKLLERDSITLDSIKKTIPPDYWNHVEFIINNYKNSQLQSAGVKYEWINSVIQRSVKSSMAKESIVERGRFDRFATHPIWGKLIAAAIVILSFTAAMILSIPGMILIMGGLPGFLKYMKGVLSAWPQWLNFLITDGLIPGISMALVTGVFIFSMFAVLGFLEDVGYLARLSYVFDNSMSRLGLHGKSMMSFLMSAGCNIGGVMGSRIIGSGRQRILTLVLTCFVPCMGLWGIVSFMGGIFFGLKLPLIILSLLGSMMIVMLFASFMLRKTVFKGEHHGLIMELPPYHLPHWKNIWLYSWGHLKSYLKKVCTFIALITVVIWTLSYFPDGNVTTSYLASFGRFIEPVGSLMGMDWRLLVSLITAAFAKEAAISSLTVLYGLSGGFGTSISSIMVNGAAFSHDAAANTLAAAISPASALAFIFAVFFSVPCMATVAVIYSETRSLKWTGMIVLLYTSVSLVMGIAAYNIGLAIF